MSESNRRKARAGLGALATAAAGAAQGAVITVDSTADITVAGDLQCTLREALANANTDADGTGGDCAAGAGSDIVQFSLPAPSTILLGGTRVTISDSLSITGPGAAALTVSGNNASRVFYIYNGAEAIAVTVSGITVTGGNGTGSAFGVRGESLTLADATLSANAGDAINHVVGGSLTVQDSTITGTVTGRGIRVDHIGAVTIDSSTISNNASTLKGGGGFFYRTTGAITITDTLVSGNSSGSRAGGLFFYDTQGTVSIADSTISGNAAGNRGGGMMFYKPLADVTIENTTISGNTSANRGGGIFFYKQAAGLTFTLRDSTVSGNQTGGTFNGGGIFFYKQAGATVLENTTISGNTAQRGGGIFDYVVNPTATLTVRNGTFAGNTATIDGGNLHLTSFAAATFTHTVIANGNAPANPDALTGASNVTLHWSLLEDPSGATLAPASSNNLTGVDPQLGPLQNNGGPTSTHLPALASPAINAGDPAFAPPPAADQRGGPRVAGARIDIGAVESNGGTIALQAATFSESENGTTATVTLVRTGGTDPATADYSTAAGTAATPGDYGATSGTASFAAGDTSTSFTIPIVDDALYEGDETLSTSLDALSPNASFGAPVEAVVTIVDDETPPVLSVDDVSQAEDSGADFDFTVTLTGATALATSVDYDTADGTAAAGSDYIATSGTLVFAPGETSKTVSVQVSADLAVEPDETFALDLSAPVNATLGTASGTGTIVNDDVSADLAITKSDGVASVQAGGSTTYTIVASNAGPSVANGATVTDTFPAGETCTWTCSGSAGGTCTAMGSGNLAQVVNLPAGASVTFLANCSISPAATGTLVNSASVAPPPGLTDPVPANNLATDSDTVTAAPGAQVSGSMSVAGTFAPGSTVTYTVVLSNAGPAAQGDNPGNEFVDTLPAGLTVSSLSASSGTIANAGNTVSWNGTIPAGGNVTLTIVATITANSGRIDNQGTIAFDTDGNATNDASALTDDPAQPGSGDATGFNVFGGGAVPSSPAIIPSLDRYGLLALLLLVALGALRRGRGD